MVCEFLSLVRFAMSIFFLDKYSPLSSTECPSHVQFLILHLLVLIVRPEALESEFKSFITNEQWRFEIRFINQMTDGKNSHLS